MSFGAALFRSIVGCDAVVTNAEWFIFKPHHIPAIAVFYVFESVVASTKSYLPYLEIKNVSLDGEMSLYRKPKV